MHVLVQKCHTDSRTLQLPTPRALAVYLLRRTVSHVAGTDISIGLSVDAINVVCNDVAWVVLEPCGNTGAHLSGRGGSQEGRHTPEPRGSRGARLSKMRSHHRSELCGGTGACLLRKRSHGSRHRPKPHGGTRACLSGMRSQGSRNKSETHNDMGARLSEKWSQWSCRRPEPHGNTGARISLIRSQGIHH
jgi:hypothetical protein